MSKKPELVALIAGKQELRILGPALRRMDGYRQRFSCAKEAGGQLFGSVSADHVIVEFVVGPRKQDERSRFSFRSNSRFAQQEIERQHSLGHVYLGEWHTHAEPFPKESGDDKLAMNQIFARSRLCTTSLLLLIRGTAPLPAGLSAFFICRGELKKLTLRIV